jgi:hypothetical protein
MYDFCGQEGSIQKNYEKVLVYRAELSMAIAMIGLGFVEILNFLSTCVEMLQKVHLSSFIPSLEQCSI